MIILKVTKNQGFTLSLEDTFFENPIDPPPLPPPSHPPPASRFRVKFGTKKALFGYFQYMFEISTLRLV